jgi:electron transport complex protein RnfD
VTGPRILTIAAAPHVHSGASVPRMMLHVVIALLPATVFAIYLFGLPALVTVTGAIAACVATERLLRNRATDTDDGSAWVTGLLYALTLPPTLPLWMVLLGGCCAIGVGKRLFGGLGSNPFNPALVGRVFLQAAFPVAMTTWQAPLGPERFTELPASTLAWPLLRADTDALTGATPLGQWKFAGVETPLTELAFGFTGGCLGETSAVLLLLGGLYLVAVRAANWRVPAAVLLAVTLASTLLALTDPGRYPGAQFMLLSGGLMLGAWFMATDPVGSPVTAAGAWLYGALIGLLVVAIRAWSGQPEGVMYAILLGNALVPHIDRHVRPRAYGTRSRAP